MALASGFCVKDQMHFDNWSSRGARVQKSASAESVAVLGFDVGSL